MKVSRSVRKGWCSTATSVVFAVAMLAASIAPTYVSTGAGNTLNHDGAAGYGKVTADEFKNLRIRGR